MKLKERKWRLEAPGEEAEPENQFSWFFLTLLLLKSSGAGTDRKAAGGLEQGDCFVAIYPEVSCCTGIRDQNNLSFLDLLL